MHVTWTKGKGGIGRLEVDTLSRQRPEKIFDWSRRIANQRHPLRPGKRSGASNIRLIRLPLARQGHCCSPAPRSLAEAEMFHADHDVDPGFDIGCGCERPVGGLLLRRPTWHRDLAGRGLSCISQEADSHLGFHAEPSPKVSGQAKIYPVCIEWAAEQIVAVVLIADGELPGVIPVLTAQ